MIHHVVFRNPRCVSFDHCADGLLLSLGAVKFRISCIQFALCILLALITIAARAAKHPEFEESFVHLAHAPLSRPTQCSIALPQWNTSTISLPAFSCVLSSIQPFKSNLRSQPRTRSPLAPGTPSLPPRFLSAEATVHLRQGNIYKAGTERSST